MLTLSRLTIEDEPLYIALYSSKQVMRYLEEYISSTPTTESFFDYLDGNGFIKGVIRNKIIYREKDIGIVSATKAISKNKWDIGMLILQEFQNKGIGAEVMLKFMRSLNEEHLIGKFTGTIPLNNHRCVSMVRKIGFIKVKESEDFSYWQYDWGLKKDEK